MIIVDDAYALPTRDWFYAQYGPALTRNLALLGAADYTPEANDCDDFGMIATALGRLNNHLFAPAREALALGFIGYTSATLGNHEIIFTVVRENDQRVLLFMEPQNRQPVGVSRAELGRTLYLYV